MPGAHRLFFALWPDDAVRAAIADVVQRELPGSVRGKRSRVERLHMTLQFLGDFNPPANAAIERAVAAATSVESPSFELLLDRLGNFGKGRVAWLGTLAPPDELQRLHRQLGDALVAGGLPAKNADAFVPHVTLGRDTRDAIERPLPALRWQVHDFVLVDSTSDEYRILGRWPLPARAVSRECRSPAAR